MYGNLTPKEIAEVHDYEAKSQELIFESIMPKKDITEEVRSEHSEWQLTLSLKAAKEDLPLSKVAEAILETYDDQEIESLVHELEKKVCANCASPTPKSHYNQVSMLCDGCENEMSNQEEPLVNQ